MVFFTHIASLGHSKLSSDMLWVLKRWAVLSCIIDALFYLAMKTLPLCGGCNENIFEAFDENKTLNTGNYMEIIKLLAEYVSIPKEHIENV